MTNITLAIDTETVEKARRVALGRDTTLTAMVIEFLEHVAEDQDTHQHQEVAVLRDRLARYRVRSGIVRWTRDELHQRR